MRCRPVKRNDRSIASFTGVGHGTFHGFELAIPLFVPIWLAAFDTSPTVLGIAVGVGYGLIGLGAPLAGVLADSYGSKRLVLVSIGGMGLAFAALSVVDSVVTLALVLMVWGAAASLYHPAGLSLISRGSERRGTVLAIHGAGGNVGMVVLPFAAILLLAFFEWRLVALALAAPAALCVVAGLLLSFEEGATTDDADVQSTDEVTVYDSIRQFLLSSRGLFVGGFVVVFTIQMVYGMYYRGIFTFLPDVLADMPIFEPVSVGDREIAAGQFAYSGLLLVGVFGQYAGGMFSDRIDPERTFVGLFASLVVASLLFVPASSVGVLPLLAVCAALGFFIYAVAPVMQALVAEYVPEGSHGLSYGYVYLGTFGIGALGAAVAGVTLDFGGVVALFGVLAGLAVGCLTLATFLFLRARRSRADRSTGSTS